jgi:microcystin-dependent protein
MPYVGEIRMVAGYYAPAGWMFCEGQALSIANPDYEALFQLIGTTYGGDGQTTFNLPDLRGRVPIHQGSVGGSSFFLGQGGGAESVTLTAQQIPAHTHPLQGTTDVADSNSPNNTLVAQPPVMLEYYPIAPSSLMSASAVGSTGGSQPHTNFQRYLCINFIVSIFGVFPSQT